MSYRRNKMSDYLKTVIEKMEQNSLREEQQIAEEVAKIKMDYVEKNGTPPMKMNASNIEPLSSQLTNIPQEE